MTAAVSRATGLGPSSPDSYAQACARGKTRVRVGFIVGPTASGKSQLALETAERLGAEIVNADSRQLYVGMNIGTAKPSAADRQRAPHHLIDIREPAAPVDVAEFAHLARSTILAIAARGRPALVVGGSGLYLRALRGGIFASPPASRDIRTELLEVSAQRGPAHLFERLRESDAAAAERIGRNDVKRIVRALEVHQQTGVPLSEHQQRHRFAQREFETLTLGLSRTRERLYQAINRRFDAMIEAGLVDEVKTLLASGTDPGAPPLSTIGYREIASFLRGEVDLADAIARAKRATRRFAKRQLTWFRADPEIVWLDADTAAESAVALFAGFFRAAETS